MSCRHARGYGHGRDDEQADEQAEEEASAEETRDARKGELAARRWKEDGKERFLTDYLLVPPGVPATVAINQASSIRVDTFMVGSFV